MFLSFIAGASWESYESLMRLRSETCGVTFPLLFPSSPHFLPPLLSQRCSTYQTVPTSPCSVYTPLSRCHHSYISCQVELASFSSSCCSAAKNKAPFRGAAMRLQSGPPQGLKLHFLTNRLHFQESETNPVV